MLRLLSYSPQILRKHSSFQIVPICKLLSLSFKPTSTISSVFWARDTDSTFLPVRGLLVLLCQQTVPEGDGGTCSSPSVRSTGAMLLPPSRDGAFPQQQLNLSSWLVLLQWQSQSHETASEGRAPTEDAFAYAWVPAQRGAPPSLAVFMIPASSLTFPSPVGAGCSLQLLLPWDLRILLLLFQFFHT